MDKIKFVQNILKWMKDKSFIEKIEQIFSFDHIIHNNSIPKFKLSSWVSEIETYPLIKIILLEKFRK